MWLSRDDVLAVAHKWGCDLVVAQQVQHPTLEERTRVMIRIEPKTPIVREIILYSKILRQISR